MTTTRAAVSPDGTSALGLLRILRDQWVIVTLSIVVCITSGLIARELIPSSYTAHSDLHRNRRLSKYLVGSDRQLPRARALPGHGSYSGDRQATTTTS
jgi:uncharacterized protein involved in exopolysaccharide biosynthesis